MPQHFYPLTVLYGFLSKSKALIFLGRTGRIEITNYQKDLLIILEHCNGLLPLDEIRRRVPQIREEVFDSLISFCIKQGILQNSRKLYLNFHADSSNPTPFFSALSPNEIAQLEKHDSPIKADGERLSLPTLTSPFLTLLGRRHSTRVFKDEFISTGKIAGLLESMYGSKRGHSVPSAGALYPLSLYILIKSDRLNTPRGCYLYDSKLHELVRLQKKYTHDDLVRIFDSEAILRNCGLIIFITADLERSSRKYSNRAYRFILDEVGHVVQNAYLFCSEQELGVVEYGGFDDRLAAEQLMLDKPEQIVISSLIVGQSDDNTPFIEPYKDVAYQLMEKYVGEDKPVEYLWVGELKYRTQRLPRLFGMAKYKPISSQVSKRAARQLTASASGAITSEVIVKTIAEAYERYRSGRYRVDKVATASTFNDEWLDPAVITPLSNKQYNNLRDLEPFSPNKEWQWVIGYRYSTGDKVYVTIDNVYYPLYSKDIKRKLCYSADSSGVAAHTNRERAITNATLELIERDALMITWYCKRQITAVPMSQAEESIRERASFLEQEGYCVKLLNLTLDSVPVILAIIHSDNNYPHFISGAGAALDFEQAITKAYSEAEFMLLSWRKIKTKERTPDQTVSPADHGKLFFQPKQRKHVRWLLDAPEELLPSSIPPVDFMNKFDPVLVDLNPEERGRSLHVVRALSEKLLPINFGYGNEHHRHGRPNVLGLRWKRKFPAFPHFFA